MRHGRTSHADLRDPVNNMPLANDPGREIWTGSAALEKAAMSHDQSSVQQLPSHPNLTHEGVGTLPQTKGYPGKRSQKSQ